MFISEDTLDDLLHEVFEQIFIKGNRVRPSGGPNREIAGVLLELRDPRARLSRTETKGTVFSAVGETLWYLSKSDRLSFIEYYISNYRKYSDDGRTLHGAYGPRIFGASGKINQLQNVIRLLEKRPSSRQAVIQIFEPRDIVRPYKDVPCTCILQFFVRQGRLQLQTYMRSNDAYLGLPHDVFAFTFLQEIVARSLRVKLGTYKHAVGSLHLYDRDAPKARQFLREGFQSTVAMPSMPLGDPAANIKVLLEIEKRLRAGRAVRIDDHRLPNYWADIARLLQLFADTKRRRVASHIKGQMSSAVFNTYIDKRLSPTDQRKHRMNLGDKREASR